MPETQSNESVCIYIARVAVGTAGGTGTVYCFIPAPSVEVADARLLQALSANDFKHQSTEFIKSYWDYEWDTKQLQKQYDRLAEEAYKSREVTFSDVDS